MPRRRRMVRRPVADDSEESALISPRLLLTLNPPKEGVALAS